jgi:hypothetical protein
MPGLGVVGTRVDDGAVLVAVRTERRSRNRWPKAVAGPAHGTTLATKDHFDQWVDPSVNGPACAERFGVLGPPYETGRCHPAFHRSWSKIEDDGLARRRRTDRRT